VQTNKNGISLGRKELRALLEAAAKESESRDLFGVQFVIDGERCFARAHNGRVSLQFEGINQAKLKNGEWFVCRKFLVDAQKELEGRQVAVFAFSGASLREALIQEDGVTLLHVTAASDVAVAQASFPQISRDVKIPSSRRDRAHCVSMGSASLKVVQYAADAVNAEHVDWYPPKNADQVVVFVAGAEKETTASGCIHPVPTKASTGEGGDDEDESPRRRGRRSDSRQQELAQ